MPGITLRLNPLFEQLNIFVRLGLLAARVGKLDAVDRPSLENQADHHRRAVLAASIRDDGRQSLLSFLVRVRAPLHRAFRHVLPPADLLLRDRNHDVCPDVSSLDVSSCDGPVLSPARRSATSQYDPPPIRQEP